MLSPFLNMSKIEKIELMLEEIEQYRIYNYDNNFFELLDTSGNIMELTVELCDKIYDYFSSPIIHYALKNNFKVVYIDLKNKSEQEICNLLKEWGALFTNDESIFMIESNCGIE